MSYRVFIPTAGIGSRLGVLTRSLNKSLITVANKPSIAHIIDSFPINTEFVIAIGHKSELVKEFIKLAYPERPIFFVQVVPFEGIGSGLGRSILACEQFLQMPFIFISCDTLVSEKIPSRRVLIFFVNQPQWSWYLLHQKLSQCPRRNRKEPFRRPRK